MERTVLFCAEKYRDQIKSTSDSTAYSLTKLPIGISPEVAVWGLDVHDKYVVACEYTHDIWYVTESELNQCFIYREDLHVIHVMNADEFIQAYTKSGASKWDPNTHVRKSCYVLDNPICGSYDVYYNSNYPLEIYGSSTPKGTYIHKFPDRFARDNFIKELDKKYSTSSETAAIDYVGKDIPRDTAIVVSDGCYSDNCTASSVWYLDTENTIHITSSKSASKNSRAVIRAEISGMLDGIHQAKFRNKECVTCYYDNIAITKILRDPKWNDVTEVRALRKIISESGITLKFVELHPKKEKAGSTNEAALMFLHNLCDKDCHEIVHIATKKYRSIAAACTKSGRVIGGTK